MISLCRKRKMKWNRRVRRIEENYGWFQKVWNTYNDKRFKCFWILSESFDFILNKIGHHNSWGTYLTSREIRNMFIQTKLKWLLSQSHIITEMTGRGLTTVQCITQEVYRVIVINLWSNFVFFVMFSSLFEAAIFSD